MIHVGDCMEVMRTLEANSVDSIVTDPPYGIGFMGKQWDRGVPGEPFWREAIRVTKPGAWLAAFSGTRTSHRMVCAIEDAGWEIRDTAMWVYGSGFPKSKNGDWGGTALKPAWEPITLARKPLEGTVEENWRKWGTGALNIDACRVEARPGDEPVAWSEPRGGIWRSDPSAQAQAQAQQNGRWPANLIHDGSDEVLALFPRTTSPSPYARSTDDPTNYVGLRGSIRKAGDIVPGFGDCGSAARFFYCAKASRADRNDGCDGIDSQMVHGRSSDGRCWGIPGSRSTPRSNNHPTVKPTDLMRWLCRLVTPPGGLILDPFTGSGSTGRGAAAEGFQFVGVELDPDYARIAQARIRAMQPGLALGMTA